MEQKEKNNVNTVSEDLIVCVFFKTGATLPLCSQRAFLADNCKLRRNFALGYICSETHISIKNVIIQCNADKSLINFAPIYDGRTEIIMDIKRFMKNENEKPLDNIVTNGGLCACFRKIACIGDSLSSGELESFECGTRGYHDYFEYSWGQFIARDAGCEVLNFSRGGMTAKEYCDSFAEINGFWNPDLKCQAYIIALGVNDISCAITNEEELGTTKDINVENYALNKPTFAGYYGAIISKYKEIQPHAKFFLVNIPSGEKDEKRKNMDERHARLLEEIASLFDNCYVIDLQKYAPEYDETFRKAFFVGGHMNVQGYRLTALMVESYIDYIIRNNPEEFAQMGFIGKLHYYGE